jgi:hypothetical protein
MSLRCLLSASLVAGALAAAPAFAAPPLGADQNPPRYVDEPELYLSLYNPGGGDGGYLFRIHAHLYGVTGDSDAVRLDWMQKGKVLASQRCRIEKDGDEGLVSCDWEGKRLFAAGEVTANLIYIDDQEEKEYLLRPFKVQVGTFYWMGKKNYQIVGDDLLGSAYVWHATTSDEFHRGEHEVRFYFWVAKAVGNISTQLRCTVDGKRQPDFKANLGNFDTTFELEDDSYGGEEPNRYHWTPVVLRPEALFYGTREEAKAATNSDMDPADTRVLAELPGAWSCDVRSDGQVLRTLRFEVTKEGRVAPHPAQSAPGAPRLLPSVAMVELILPKQNSFDERVRPDAIKASDRYGLPWPRHDSIKARHAQLPPASGLPDPGKGKKRGK